MSTASDNQNDILPEILAPAGDEAAFLAAISAGADSVYCGLKHFSARMEARNFSTAELVSLCELARKKGKKTYVALNTLLKPGEESRAASLLARLAKEAKPEGIIASDLSLPGIARDVGFKGEVHLSTLGGFTTASGLEAVQKAGFSRAVLPREMTVDEIKNTAAHSRIGLEVFIHGALCYAISGRCYWSSLLGGKSGLRGRCVQPCRRMYEYRRHKDRFFSCLDLGLDVLVKPLLQTPAIRALKIEGRKKGAHYVYYTTSAYRLLLDRPNDPAAKKDAQALLKSALGRPSTHFFFLPQRPFNPTESGEERASGLFVATTRKKGKSVSISPRTQLLKNDLLRIGSEEDKTHQTIGIKKTVPAKGQFNLPPSVPGRLPVFLIDRKEPELLRILDRLRRELPPPGNSERPPEVELTPIASAGGGKKALTIHVQRLKPGKPSGRKPACFWADTPQILAANLDRRFGKQWIWLPPAVWPNEEKDWQKALQTLKDLPRTSVVLGAPWQAALLPEGSGPRIWAGPFCNLANARALEAVRELGCCGAFLSPELGEEDLLILAEKTPLATGLVTKGIWPACVSRIPATGIKPARAVKSPKEETFWTMRYGGNYWVFPNWEINLTGRETELHRAGFSLFAHLEDRPPGKIELKKRPGLWNFEHGLL
ncbi:MAG: peptidase U32 family protein [Desulfonatronovibrionaceae bacterium]